jgi:hypothetical protein
LLEESCLLNVVHTEKDGNTHANIRGASPLPKGVIAPELVNETRSLEINSIPYSDIDGLPQFTFQHLSLSTSKVGL